MPDPMTGYYEGLPRAERVEVITSVQRRRRWSTGEKVQIVEETYLPGNSVSLVARHHGIAANQLFTWRRLMAQGALTAAGAGEQVVPASELRAALPGALSRSAFAILRPLLFAITSSSGRRSRSCAAAGRNGRGSGGS